MYYFLTIRAHKVHQKVTCCELSHVINHVKWMLAGKSMTIVNVCYEVDPTYKQLHAHAIVRTTHYLDYRGLISYAGYRIYYQPLVTQNDLHRTQVYCAKDDYQWYNFNEDY